MFSSFKVYGIFFLTFLGVANLDPRGMVGRIYKGTTRYC